MVAAPQDHKSKAGKVTVRGVELSIDKDVFDDFELLDDLKALQDQSAVHMPSVMRRLVGDQFPKVMDALRGENGRVQIEQAGKFIQELIEAVNPNS